jgi:DNA invertase Pin-like site-specific DNA recombinase
MDTTTPHGKLVFNVFAALAEFERELIIERTKAGLAAARARGRLGITTLYMYVNGDGSPKEPGKRLLLGR